MRIKHNYIKLHIKQPERRFNENSNRKKIADIINDLNKPCLLSEVIEQAEVKHNINNKNVLAIISKLKQCGYLNIETYNTNDGGNI